MNHAASLPAHGGDVRAMAALSGRDAASLLDFSVNIRPEGPPEFLRATLRTALKDVGRYPSPDAAEAMDAAARRHDLPRECFAFGNGSNELLHALGRVLGKRAVPEALIVQPAFSEYALACTLAGVPVRAVFGGVGLPLPDRPPLPTQALIATALTTAAPGAAVFLANPANPSGALLTPEACAALMASRPDCLWIVDEAFIAYAGEEAAVSLLPRLAHLPCTVVVVRSLTKFYALPGLRAGYLAVAPQHAALARAVRAELPAWNVNALALACAVAALDEPDDHARRTRAENAARREDLLGRLHTLPGVRPCPSAANYVLFHWAAAPDDLNGALLRRYGMALRDCANYPFLEAGGWFRAAVRLPCEHERLIGALAALARGGG